MNERKEIVRQMNTRKSQHDKLKEALAKKPTAAQFNSALISPVQLEQLAEVPAEKQKFLNERLVRNAKKKKRFASRPEKIFNYEPLNKTYMDSPSSDGISQEWPTPDWFRTTEKADVSVIVPLYKSHGVILDMIRTWPFENNYKVEIIFVDDCCPNNSKEVVLEAWRVRKNELKAPVGRIIYNVMNKGYGQACNAGMNVATGDYLIFLNADTKVTPGWIEPMIQLFDDPKVGLVGNMHLKEGGVHDGTIDSAGSEWKWNDMSFVHIGRHCYKKQSINSPFRIENAPKDILEVREREMVTGCCFAMPTDLCRYIGGFNPNYKIGYWEDTEICLSVRELGYKILFQPKSIIYHKLGHTSSGGHKYFQHNREYFMNKWVKSHRLDSLLFSEARPSSKNPVKSILLRRTNAHGDTLVAAGVCAALKKKYPEVKILFSTLHPELLQGNPYVDEFVEIRNIEKAKFDVFYNLDLCYEYRSKINILTAYAEAVGVKTEDCKICIGTKKPNFELPENYVVIHAGSSDWVGRNWPTANFAEISKKLMEHGEKVVAVGKYTESAIPCTLDVRSETSVTELAWIMKNAKAFIGIDSMPMHIAQTFDTPGISFFGSVDPKLYIFNSTMKPITAKNLPCLGCYHRQPVPCTATKRCETGTLDCINKVTVDDMWERVKELLVGVNNERVSLLG